MAYAQNGGRLVVTGDAGRYDAWNAQRRENPLVPRLRGLKNVAIRDMADIIPGANLGWRHTVDPPKDGGKALMSDLEKAGWRSPVAFEGLPAHVFVEYRRLRTGAIVAHLVNYIPETPVKGVRLCLKDGERATLEEPLADRPQTVQIGADGKLPNFGMYAIVTIANLK